MGFIWHFTCITPIPKTMPVDYTSRYRSKTLGDCSVDNSEFTQRAACGMPNEEQERPMRCPKGGARKSLWGKGCTCVMLVGGPRDVWWMPASATTLPSRFLQYLQW